VAGTYELNIKTEVLKTSKKGNRKKNEIRKEEYVSTDAISYQKGIRGKEKRYHRRATNAHKQMWEKKSQSKEKQ